MLDRIVIGIDRNTGEERVLAVNALTEDEARAEASAKGMMVEFVRVKTSSDTSPATGKRSSAIAPIGKSDVRMRKGRDPLSVPRLVMLLIAVAYSFGVGFAGFDRVYAYLLWGCWLALGVAGIILRAARS